MIPRRARIAANLMLLLGVIYALGALAGGVGAMIASLKARNPSESWGGTAPVYSMVFGGAAAIMLVETLLCLCPQRSLREGTYPGVLNALTCNIVALLGPGFALGYGWFSDALTPAHIGAVVLWVLPHFLAIHLLRGARVELET